MQRKKGFTMIEMLIVVAVLGILAAALLATIDPFEQMKKARDTTLRNAVVDVFDAVTRYYGTNGQMPWEVTGATCDVADAAANLGASAPVACIDDLITAGELKQNFVTQLGAGNAARIYMDLTTVDEVSLRVCFSPDSKAIRGEVNTKYAMIGGDIENTSGGSCPDVTLDTCYWCIQ